MDETHCRSFDYRPGLDGLRAVAVLAVVAYHYSPRQLPGGFLGVDVFFVLSGYLIGGLLLTEADVSGRASLSRFWARRAKRLLPALGLLLVAVCAYGAWLAPRDTLARLRGDLLSTCGYVANWRFVLVKASYFDVTSVPSPLRHMWSLAIEEQFYLLFPLLVVACLAVGRPGALARRLGVVCMTLAAASVALMWLLADPIDPSRAYYGTDTRAQALLLGVVTACLLHGRTTSPRWSRWCRQVVGTVAAAAMVVAFLHVRDHDVRMYHGGFGLFAVIAACVIAAAVEAGPLRRVLSWRPARALGRVSYGVYLWHWPVQVVLDPARTGLSGWRIEAVWLLVTGACASVSYRFVETPVRRGTFRPVRTAFVSVSGAGALLTVVFVATAGAVAAPAELVGTGTHPRYDVLVPERLTTPSRSISSPRPATVPASPVPSARPPPRRIVLFGDSVAATLRDGLAAQAEARGIGLVSLVQPGCGVATGPVAWKGAPVPWSYDCEAPMRHAIDTTVESNRPDVVVVLSTWETADRIVAGRILTSGTPAWKAEVLARLDVLYASVHRFGARVVFVDVVPAAASSLRPADRSPRNAIYDALLEAFAQTHADVGVAHFGRVLCPAGPPCPRTVDGLVPRPNDGAHFTPQTTGWGAAGLWPLLEAAWTYPGP